MINYKLNSPHNQTPIDYVFWQKMAGLALIFDTKIKDIFVNLYTEDKFDQTHGLFEFLKDLANSHQSKELYIFLPLTQADAGKFESEFQKAKDTAKAVIEPTLQLFSKTVKCTYLPYLDTITGEIALARNEINAEELKKLVEIQASSSNCLYIKENIDNTNSDNPLAPLFSTPSTTAKTNLSTQPEFPQPDIKQYLLKEYLEKFDNDYQSFINCTRKLLWLGSDYPKLKAELPYNLAVTSLAAWQEKEVPNNLKANLLGDLRQLIADPLEYLEGEMREAYLNLAQVLPRDGRLAIAFSGGVDSSLLFFVASRVLGKDNVMGVLGLSVFTPKREITAARNFARAYNLCLGEAEFSQEEMEGLFPNPQDRCYHCKKMLFTNFLTFAKKSGCTYLAEGSNLNDLGDYRPGMKAIDELKVLSPLRLADFDKKKIRGLSKALGLPTAMTPSLACLATRLPYNHRIRPEILTRIDQAEEYLLQKGIQQLRVRVHGDIARIEVNGDEIMQFLDLEFRLAVDKKFKELGFIYVTLDLAGYKTGSMNVNIQTNKQNV